MERKNMVLLTVIAVATLLVAVVGATFAYFTATVKDTRDGSTGKGETSITTTQLASEITVANIDSAAGKFTATDVFPGHMEVAGMEVTIKGESGSYVVPFEYKVTANDISTNGGTVNYYLYKDEDASITDFTSKDLGCTFTNKAGESNEVQYSEECTFKNAAEVKESPTGVSKVTSLKLVAKGALKAAGGEETINMLDTVAEVSSEKTVNYYFVVEYHNNDKAAQNNEQGKTLTGTITVAGAQPAAA